MSESGNGGSNGKEIVTIAREKLIDELVLVFDRESGGMSITGTVASDEVALMMFQRAVNIYTARTRAQYALALREQMLEQERIRALANSTRGGRT